MRVDLTAVRAEGRRKASSFKLPRVLEPRACSAGYDRPLNMPMQGSKELPVDRGGTVRASVLRT